MSKIFISNLNSYLGQCLLEELSSLPSSELLGTIEPSLPSLPYSSSSKIISSSDILEYKASLLSSDIIIFDLHTADLLDVQDKAKLLMCSNFPSAKALIIISSVNVWGATKPKMVERSPEELAELEEGDEEKFKVAEYENSEYKQRKAPEEFRGWKGIETLAMSIGMNKPELDVYVLAAGVIYGNGEKDLEYLFKTAWLEKPSALPIVGDGCNYVPTIHVRDLARAVKHVIQVKPVEKYLFVVDSSSSQLQKDLIKSISEGVGTGKVEFVNFEDVQNEPWAKALKLNVKVSPSKLFLPPTEEELKEEQEAEEEENAEELEEGEERPKKAKPIRMQWHCLKGLIGEVRKINVEFNEARGLKPITVYISGPPGAGKTYYSKQLAEYYNVPRIDTASVVAKVLELQSELGETIRTKLSELKDEMLEEAENNKKEDEEINPDSIKPRIPKDLLCKAFRWVLNQNPCRNRGYILDGFPKTYDDAWSVFKIKPPSKGEEEEADEEEVDRSKMITDMEIFPQSVIDFNGTEEELIEKVKRMPEEAIKNTHYNLVDMKRRIKEYSAANNNPTGLPSVTDFFVEESVDVLHLHCNDENALEAAQIYMERFGKPVNYQVAADIREARRIEEKEIRRVKELEAEKELVKKEEEIEVDKRIMRNEEIKKKNATLQQREIDHLERMAEHVKGYMLENVYEALAIGLFKVASKKREDPVDYLARYLFKHADGIPHPDPNLY